MQVGILRSRPPDTPHCAAGTASPGSAGIPPASCAFGRGCARLCAGGTPALPGSHHPMTGHEFAEAFWRRLSLKEVHLYSCVFVFIRGSSSLMIGRFSWNDPHGRAGARPNRYQGGSRRSRTARLRQRGIQTIPGSAAGRSISITRNNRNLDPEYRIRIGRILSDSYHETCCLSWQRLATETALHFNFSYIQAGSRCGPHGPGQL